MHFVNTFTTYYVSIRTFLLTCSDNCVTTEANQDSALKLSINDNKLYITDVSLSAKENTKLLQILNSGMRKQSIGMNTYHK